MSGTNAGGSRRYGIVLCRAISCSRLVAYNTTNTADERLIGKLVLNPVIVLLTVSSMLAPILSARFTMRLPALIEAAKKPAAITVGEPHAVL